jgi:hypothetical protein
LHAGITDRAEPPAGGATRHRKAALVTSAGQLPQQRDTNTYDHFIASAKVLATGKPPPTLVEQARLLRPVFADVASKIRRVPAPGDDMLETSTAARTVQTESTGSVERIADLQRQVAELQHEVDNLVEAMATRQLIGWVTGLLGGSLGLTSDQAWSLLARLSQHTNVKVREIARVLAAADSGEITDADQPLVNQFAALLDGSWQLFASVRPANGTVTEHLQQRHP